MTITVPVWTTVDRIQYAPKPVLDHIIYALTVRLLFWQKNRIFCKKKIISAKIGIQFFGIEEIEILGTWTRGNSPPPVFSPTFSYIGHVVHTKIGAYYIS